MRQKNNNKIKSLAFARLNPRPVSVSDENRGGMALLRNINIRPLSLRSHLRFSLLVPTVPENIAQKGYSAPDSASLSGER